MGTKSFGKGSVQTIMPLGGRGAIRLTTSLYYTPSGRTIQATGIQPDIEVEQVRLEPISGGPKRSEARLRNHLPGASEDGSEQEDGDPPSAAAEELEDYQLARAIDLLHGIALASNLRAN